MLSILDNASLTTLLQGALHGEFLRPMAVIPGLVEASQSVIDVFFSFAPSSWSKYPPGSPDLRYWRLSTPTVDSSLIRALEGSLQRRSPTFVSVMLRRSESNSPYSASLDLGYHFLPDQTGVSLGVQATAVDGHGHRYRFGVQREFCPTGARLVVSGSEATSDPSPLWEWAELVFEERTGGGILGPTALRQKKESPMAAVEELPLTNWDPQMMVVVKRWRQWLDAILAHLGSPKVSFMPVIRWWDGCEGPYGYLRPERSGLPLVNNPRSYQILGAYYDSQRVFQGPEEVYRMLALLEESLSAEDGGKESLLALARVSLAASSEGLREVVEQWVEEMPPVWLGREEIAGWCQAVSEWMTIFLERRQQDEESTIKLYPGGIKNSERCLWEAQSCVLRRLKEEAERFARDQRYVDVGPVKTFLSGIELPLLVALFRPVWEALERKDEEVAASYPHAAMIELTLLTKRDLGEKSAQTFLKGLQRARQVWLAGDSAKVLSALRSLVRQAEREQANVLAAKIEAVIATL